jgi:hypothetical protein
VLLHLISSARALALALAAALVVAASLGDPDTASAAACDADAAPGLLAQAREPGAELVLARALRPGWLEVGGAPRPVRLLGTPACREARMPAGALLAVLHGGGELRQGVASLRALATPPPASLAGALRRWQRATSVEQEAGALLELLALDGGVVAEASARLLELAVERRLPAALVAELGRLARRPGVGRAELSAYLEVGRSLKPDWYDEVVIWHLRHGSPELLALAGEHTLACWEERVVISVLGRLRDRDAAARAAAAAILHDRTGQRFERVAEWEAWLRRNLAHRRLP